MYGAGETVGKERLHCPMLHSTAFSTPLSRGAFLLRPHFSITGQGPNLLQPSFFCPKLNKARFWPGCISPPKNFHESSISAADWSQFKRSSEVGFCRRQRCYKSTTEESYRVRRNSIKVSKWRGDLAFTASLESRDGKRNGLSLAIIPLENGIFRVVMSDSHEGRQERYVIKGITMDQSGVPPINGSMLTITEKLALISLPCQTAAISIHLDPFQVDLVDQKSGKVSASVNSESRLMIEEFAKARLSDYDDEIEKVEEKFGDYVDPQRRGPESVGIDVSFPRAEQLHGIPERTSQLSIPDTKLSTGEIVSEPYRMYNLDVPYYELNKELGLYGSVPLLYARRGLEATGIFWHNASETYVDTRTSSLAPHAMETHWFSESGFLDLFLLPGPQVNDVFKQYLFLTGAPTLPPLFSLGYHQCRYSYEDDADVREVDRGFSSRSIPYDTIWLDIDHTDEKRYFTFDRDKFPEPVKLQEDLAKKGRRCVAIIDPHIKRDDSYVVHTLSRKEGLYVTRPNGTEYEGECWAGKSSYLDFVSPRVRKKWGEMFRRSVYREMTDHLHVWNDMNEPAVFDGPEGTMPKDVLHDGVEHRHVHNLYGHSMARATYEGLLAIRPDKRPFVLTRSFFAGTQRFAAVWTGDNESSWEHLQASVGMLNALQICGIGLSGADVGGFFGDPSAELMVRWYQAGAFQPFFRGHSNKGTKRREPWLLGREVTDCVRKAIKSRYEFLTYWYTLFASMDTDIEIENRGPPMRPIWWEFEGWDDSEGIWMAGDCLLIAPVIEPGVKRHVINLPQGRWYDVYDRKKELRTTLDARADLDRLVVLLRGGKVVPMLISEVRSSVDSMLGEYALLIGLDGKGSAEGSGYFDDGESQKFRMGDYTVMKWRFETEELAVERVTGDFISEAVLTKIDICGYGKEIPTRVVMVDENGTSAVRFKHCIETGVLQVEGINKSMTRGSWKLKIDRRLEDTETNDNRTGELS